VLHWVVALLRIAEVEALPIVVEVEALLPIVVEVEALLPIVVEVEALQGWRHRLLVAVVVAAVALPLLHNLVAVVVG